MKLVLDADGLIKLYKAGILKLVTQSRRCSIAQAVYKEAITQGKERMYEDAVGLEEVVRHTVAWKVAPASAQAKRILDMAPSLGKGERETLQLFFMESADAIVSDDRNFLTVLEQYGVNYIVPAALIVILYREGRIVLNEAQEALERIRPLIRRGVYEQVKEDLERRD